MQAPVFFGRHPLVLDQKNRLLVPSDVRRRIKPEHGSSFFLIIGTYNNVPWLYPDEYYESLATQGRQTLLPDQQTTDFYRLAFGMASLLPIDKQGRILIPARTLEQTAVKDQKDVVLVGVYDHLELWPTGAWSVQEPAMMASSAEITLKAKAKEDSQKSI